MALGSNEQNNSQNPFNGYQTIYLSLFSNNVAPDHKDFVRGVNDSMHFRAALALDQNQKSNSKIMELTKGKEYFSLPTEKKVSGYLKSVMVLKETIDGKPSKKVQITLFDPMAPYYNPFESIDTTNPKNGTTVGAVYIIKSAFTLKSKELLSKLSNLDTTSDEMITISVVPANTKDSGYKDQLVIKGKKIYNIFIKQGETVLRERFGDIEKSSFVKHDNWNEQYVSILAENEDDALRINMDGFYEKFVKTVLAAEVNDIFLRTLRDLLKYELVPNGTNQDGTPRMKYSPLESVLDATDVATYLPATEKSFKDQIEATMPDEVPTSSLSDDDLPF